MTTSEKQKVHYKENKLFNIFTLKEEASQKTRDSGSRYLIVGCQIQG